MRGGDCSSCLVLGSMKQKQGHHEGHEEHEGGNAAGFNHRWTQIEMITKVWLSLKRLGNMVSA